MIIHKLSVKTILLIMLCFGVSAMVIVQLLVRAYVERPQLERIQYAADLKDVQRIDRAYEFALQELASRANDNAKWDDAYRFIVDLNEAFIRANIVENTFTDNNIGGIAFFDMTNNLRFSMAYEAKSRTMESGHPFTPIQLQVDILLASKQTGADRAGFIRDGRDRILAFASKPILPSSEDAQARGTLVVWRVLDEAFVAQLIRQTGLFYEMGPISRAEMTEEVSRRFSESTLKTVEPRNEHNQIAWYMYDLNGVPLRQHVLTFESSYFTPDLFSLSVLAEISVAIILLALSAWVIHRVFIRPLSLITRSTRSIAQSKDYRTEIHMVAAVEFEQLAVQFNELMRTVYDQEMVLQTQNLKLRLENIRDPLTGISNRRYLDEYLESCWKWSLEESKPFAVVLMDVDSFKAYNDFYGHPAGDKVLKAVASLLKTSVDSAQGNVARYGGEEFCAVLIEQSEQQVRWWCNEVLEEIALLEIEHEKTALGQLSISIGVAYGIAADYRQLRNFFQIADQELYRAKDAGKNCVRFSDVA